MSEPRVSIFSQECGWCMGNLFFQKSRSITILMKSVLTLSAYYKAQGLLLHKKL